MRQLTAGMFFEIEIEIEEGVKNSDIANQLSKLFDVIKETEFDGFKVVDIQGELGLESPDKKKKEEEEENPLMRDDIIEV